MQNTPRVCGNTRCGLFNTYSSHQLVGYDVFPGVAIPSKFPETKWNPTLTKQNVKRTRKYTKVVRSTTPSTRQHFSHHHNYSEHRKSREKKPEKKLCNPAHHVLRRQQQQQELRYILLPYFEVCHIVAHARLLSFGTLTLHTLGSELCSSFSMPRKVHGLQQKMTVFHVCPA